MTKKFCIFFSLKVAAMTMSFICLVGGCGQIIGGATGLYDYSLKIHNATNVDHTDNVRTLSIVCILIGIFIIICGVILVAGIIQGNHRYVMIYFFANFINLFTITIYSGIIMFEHGAVTILFIFSVFLCYTHYCVYGFFEEMCEYNTVKPGVSEIEYNEHAASYFNSIATPTNEQIENSKV